MIFKIFKLRKLWMIWLEILRSLFKLNCNGSMVIGKKIQYYLKIIGSVHRVYLLGYIKYYCLIYYFFPFFYRTIPLTIIIVLGVMVPVIIYVTYLSTTSMFKFSALYDERVEVYRQEKRKTEKLLTDLLPRQIIRQMKRGQVPAPESFECVSVFLW